jgi:hypothetical protein
MTPITTDTALVPLNADQLGKLKEITGKLKFILYVNPAAFETLSTNVDNAMASIGGSPASLSAAAKAVCLGSAGRFGGQGAVALRAAFEAKKKADERVVASIPSDMLVALKCSYGYDVGTLADKWREQTAPAKARR